MQENFWGLPTPIPLWGGGGATPLFFGGGGGCKTLKNMLTLANLAVLISLS